MRIFQDINSVVKLIMVLDFDEYRKIVLESTRTGRLITDIIQDVLVWGLENYPYTEKKDANYGGSGR